MKLMLEIVSSKMITIFRNVILLLLLFPVVLIAQEVGNNSGEDIDDSSWEKGRASFRIKHNVIYLPDNSSGVELNFKNATIDEFKNLNLGAGEYVVDKWYNARRTAIPGKNPNEKLIINNRELELLLVKWKVYKLGRLVPGFDPADTLKVPNDMSRFYFIRFPDSVEVKNVLDDLRLIEGIDYPEGISKVVDFY